MAHIRQIYPNLEIRLEHINESGVFGQVTVTLPNQSPRIPLLEGWPLYTIDVDHGTG